MKKKKAFVLAVILFVISFVVIVLLGRTYTIKTDNVADITNIDELKVEIDDENVIRCIDKQLVDGEFKVKVKGISRGKTFYRIEDAKGNTRNLNSIYVHAFGIITINEYLGESNGSIIIPISLIIWLAYVLYLLVISYKQSVKENMYQYKNIAYLGIIIFISFSIISQLLAISNYSGFINTVYEVINMFSFAIVLLPIAFVLSILVMISIIVLIKKEGFSFTNILGLILGAMLCLASVTPEFLYRMLYSATWIDVHNQNGIGLYIYNLVEMSIFTIITYVECVLIGTIAMEIKSARHIPKFNKDYIVILGCQIKKDGSLTNLLKGRVDRAINFGKIQKEKTGKSIIYVPSGGKGNDETIAEALAMKNYLLSQGIPEEKILLEDKSKNTFENIKFSNRLISEKNEDANVAFSTTNYHVFRTGNIATEQGLNFEGIGSKTKQYFWINAFVREFIATIYSQRKRHVAVLLSMLIFNTFMIGITYINNMI